MAALNLFAEHAPDFAQALTAEHRQLSVALARVAASGGPMGEAAKRLAALCSPHFRLEEKIYYPALRAVRDVARGDSAEAVAPGKRIARLNRLYARIEQQHSVILPVVAELLELNRHHDNRDLAIVLHTLKNHEQIEAQLYWDAKQLTIAATHR